MKLELNLDEIFEGMAEQDEDGETTRRSIKESVIHQVVEAVKRDVKAKLEDRLDEALTEAVKQQTNEFIKQLIPQMVDQEFTPTTSWGEKSKTTTVRNEIYETIKKQCVYEQSRSGYSSDTNQFTKAVKDVVEEKMREFKKTFDNKIGEELTREAYLYAQGKLQERLGLKT